MADVKILIEGYTSGETNGRSCSTVVLVQDELNGVKINIIVDPGTLPSQKRLKDELNKSGLKVEDIGIVFITHSHMDHYKNIGMFPKAKALDFYGLFEDDLWIECDGKITKNIEIINTSGHSDDSMTMLVKTNIDGNDVKVAICGDVFWKEDFPDYDKLANDNKKLKETRKKVLILADYIIPGHGNMFKVKK